MGSGAGDTVDLGKVQGEDAYSFFDENALMETTTTNNTIS